MGKKLNAIPRKAYKEYAKYFKNHIVKPFGESVVDFYCYDGLLPDVQVSTNALYQECPVFL